MNRRFRSWSGQLGGLARDDWMVWLRAALLVGVCWLAALAIALAADPPGLPPSLLASVTCDQVRSLVAEHGRIVAYAWAKLQGFSDAQINEAARRCLGEHR